MSASTALTTADNQTIYVKFTYAQGSTCEMTSKDGYLYYVNASNRLYKVASQPSLAAGTQYGTATYSSVNYYHDSELSDELTPAEKTLIDAGSVTVKFTAGARARVSNSAPNAVGNDFFNATNDETHPGFGTALANSVTQTATIAAGGAVSGLATIYYAVNGSGTQLIDATTLDNTYVGTDVSEVNSENWNDGTSANITQNITIDANS